MHKKTTINLSMDHWPLQTALIVFIIVVALASFNLLPFRTILGHSTLSIEHDSANISVISAEPTCVATKKTTTAIKIKMKYTITTQLW